MDHHRPEAPSGDLAPASIADFQVELSACLTLCSPVGMGEQDRREWLKVAWATLDGIPADLLARGCAQARKTADHPAKIVPAIIREIDEAWAWRKQRQHRDEPPRLPAPAIPPVKFDTAAILAEYGLAGDPDARRQHRPGPPRQPTREDYIAMGVDPEAIDGIETERRI